MNWCSIAEFLRVSHTLQRRRIMSNFLGNDLDNVQEILHLTPYSEESYVRGVLK